MPRASHKYFLAAGPADDNGDRPCWILTSEMADEMLLDGCAEFKESRTDSTLLSLTKKFTEELEGATFH